MCTVNGAPPAPSEHLRVGLADLALTTAAAGSVSATVTRELVFELLAAGSASLSTGAAALESALAAALC